MTAVSSNLPNGRKTYFDNNGTPLAGGSVNFYIPGTTSPVTTYEDDGNIVQNQNPIILDSSGSCVAFGVGEMREYVTDALGNVISDTIVVASSPLIVNPAMLPVIEATSVAAASELLLAAVPAVAALHLNISAADQSLSVSPTANAPTTLASLNVQGPTVSVNGREFLVNLGLVSQTGQGGTPGNDKVTLYSGLDMKPGSADGWTLNTCLTMEPGLGPVNVQGYELDFNNLAGNRGNSGTLLTDFSAPIANGLSITGAGNFTSTTGISLNSQGSSVNPQWARGITTLGKMSICAIQEWSTAPVGIQMDGGYTIAAINLTSLYGNAGAVTPTAMFLKNAQSLTWQDSTTTKVISDSVDGNNNRVIGLPSVAGATNSIILCAPTVPQETNIQDLGSGTKRWKDVWATNMRLENANVLSWDNNPANNGGISAFIFDYADNLNNRIVGSGAQTIYMAAQTAPITAGLNLGTSVNYWGSIFSLTGVVAPSDIALKTDIQPLPSMLDTLMAIEPLSYKWKDQSKDTDLHYGFSADQVRDIFPKGFAGYSEIDGVKGLRKDELISVLWKACQELTDRVRKLELDSVF